MSDKKIIGIDLGGTSAKIGILNNVGEVDLKWSINTDNSDQGAKIVPNIIQSLKENLNQLGLTSADILGIGMGSPGSVNRSNGTVIGAYNLNWKTLQPIRQQIEDVFGVPFFIDNDANVAALGEQWVGAGNSEPDVSFITVGTGVGSGLIVDGQLVHGANDSAGEIGHLTVEPNGYQCTCGKKGCLEQYASATGIVRLAHDMSRSESKDSPLLNAIRTSKEIDSKLIFDFAKDGDEFAESVVDQFSYYLGIALSNVSNLLNPSTIVLGGGVSKAGDYLVKKVSKIVQDYTFPPIRETTKIKIAELGNDAGMIGAASLVLNELERD